MESGKVRKTKKTKRDSLDFLSLEERVQSSTRRKRPVVLTDPNHTVGCYELIRRD